jgi:hypothetical protein
MTQGLLWVPRRNVGYLACFGVDTSMYTSMGSLNQYLFSLNVLHPERWAAIRGSAREVVPEPSIDAT